MNTEFIEALDELEKEKNISKDVIVDALETALIAAYKKNYKNAGNVVANVDRLSGEILVCQQKIVVDEITDPKAEILIEEAKTISPKYEVGDVVSFEVTPGDFGRVAAQTAKQVVLQKIREAERGLIYEEFSGEEHKIITGKVLRVEKSGVIIELGRIETMLLPQEQIPGETYSFNQRIKLFVVEVKMTTKGPQILISRSRPGFVKKLFEQEVPEITQGIVEIKSIAREAGSRTKIAVASTNEAVDPVGSCVGPRGGRVQIICNELGGEKIDIVKWNDDPVEFISEALNPAKTISVDVDEKAKTAKVVVQDDQLSLAIGKEGQNARLVARLTGYKIDIKPESKAE